MTAYVVIPFTTAQMATYVLDRDIEYLGQVITADDCPALVEAYAVSASAPVADSPEEG